MNKFVLFGFRLPRYILVIIGIIAIVKQWNSSEGTPVIPQQVKIAPKLDAEMHAHTNQEEMKQCLTYVTIDVIDPDLLLAIPVHLVRTFEHLRTLEIYNSAIEEISSFDFADHQCLKNVFLMKNRLAVIKTWAFNNLPELKHINLSENRIVRIETDAFIELPSLKTINLNKNMLKELPRGLFRNISTLWTLVLSHNDFSKVEPYTFDGLRNLQQLKLNYNHLTVLPEKVFHGLSNLRELDLSHNELKLIPSNSFKPLMNLKKLSLKNNKLVDHKAHLYNNLRSISFLDGHKTLMKMIIRSKSSTPLKHYIATLQLATGKVSIQHQHPTSNSSRHISVPDSNIPSPELMEEPLVKNQTIENLLSSKKNKKGIIIDILCFGLFILMVIRCRIIQMEFRMTNRQFLTLIILHTIPVLFFRVWLSGIDIRIKHHN